MKKLLFVILLNIGLVYAQHLTFQEVSDEVNQAYNASRKAIIELHQVHNAVIEIDQQLKTQNNINNEILIKLNTIQGQINKIKQEREKFLANIHFG